MPRRKGRRISSPRRPPVKSPSEDPFLLDRFSQQDLTSWDRNSALLMEFRVKQFYYLEGLRAVQRNELLDSLKATAPSTIDLNGWTRIVDYRFSLKPLAATGSIVMGGRFNIGNDLDPSRFSPFPALYLAENYQTAYAEKFGDLPDTGILNPADLALRKPASFTSVTLKGELGGLFDLRHTRNLKPFCEIIGRFKLSKELKELSKRIGKSGAELILNHNDLHKNLLDPGWRANAALFDLPANSQIFAQLVKESGFEGIVFRSSKGNGLCVALFVEKLEGSSSYVQLADQPPSTDVIDRLDSTNWRDLQ